MISSGPSNSARFRAVIADDVPELRQLLRHILERTELFEVVGEAANGQEAIDLAELHLPDLLLLDISMPVLDGMEALPLILAASPSTKVVVLAGFEASRLSEAVLNLGARAYIEKGVPPSALVKQLVDLLGEERTFSPSDLSASAPLTDFSSEDMMSLVAHEIRNPLAVIQGFGNELQSRWATMADEQRLDAVKRMTERARYLNTIVSNLMYMRKVGSDEAVPQSIELELGATLDGMADELRDLARGHEVLVTVAPGLPNVVADLPRIRQVLTNLVVNAAKFGPRGTPIRIIALADGGDVAIEVTDEGPGIPADKREVVFQKFERLERGGAGIGLGLFISRALMASMGGELHVHENGPGATLRCTLRSV